MFNAPGILTTAPTVADREVRARVALDRNGQTLREGDRITLALPPGVTRPNVRPTEYTVTRIGWTEHGDAVVESTCELSLFALDVVRVAP